MAKKESTFEMLIEITDRNLYNRKIVIWEGSNLAGQALLKYMQKNYKMNAEYFVSTDVSRINSVTVFSVDTIADKREEIYLMIPIAYSENVEKQLHEFGFEKDCDYAYCSYKAITVTACDGYYKDEYGNEIKGKFDQGNLIFHERNAVVEIGENVRLAEDFRLDLYDDAHLMIGDNTKIQKANVWDLRKGSQLQIGENGIFDDGGRMKCGKNSIISVGKNLKARFRYWIVSPMNTSITVGDDCTFSWDVMIRTSDGHSIFDVNTGKNINSLPEENYNRKIMIGDHVWIGARAIIMQGTVIGNGSIIGAASFINKKYPNNCIVAGSPGRILRRDVAWAFENCLEDMSMINSDYVELTRMDDDNQEIE